MNGLAHCTNIEKKNRTHIHGNHVPVVEPSTASKANRRRSPIRLTDLYDLLSEVLALQQPQKCFGHLLNPVEHVLFEANFTRLLPSG